MIPLAFYAPLKAPGHPTPSGDREIARALRDALRGAGFDPVLASDLRSLDTVGDRDKQNAIRRQASAQLPALIAHGAQEGWRAWVSYHNYYKAPDLLGPSVSKALGIPYVQIESTRARKRLTGPWERFASAAEAAADAATAILFFTDRDAKALRAYHPEGQTLRHLPPFLNRTDLPVAGDRQGPLLAVGMMRPGDKLASYELIAATLERLREDTDWRLDIAGDGTARPQVEALMAPFGDRVRFLGQLDAEGLARAYASARALIWPGVNEAIGLTYLEAQAAGVPVLAQDRPGLREVIAPDNPLVPVEAGPDGLAAMLRQFAEAPPDAVALRKHISARHLRAAAAGVLKATLEEVI